MMRPENPYLYQSAVNVINQFQGPLFVLFSKKNTESIKSHLADNALTIEEPSCQVIKSNLEVVQVFLCPLRRISPTKQA